MTSRLTQTILGVLEDQRRTCRSQCERESLTSQLITSRVRKTLPGVRHPAVTTELVRLAQAGEIKAYRAPYLPVRFAAIFSPKHRKKAK